MERKTFLRISLTIIAGLCIYYMTPSLSEPIRITLAIFTIAIILWVSEWVPFFATSFLILLLEVVFLFPKLDTDKSAGIFFEPFFSPVTTLFLGGFALSFAIHKYRLDHILALWILHKSQGNPEKLLTFLLLLSAGLSMWFSNTATTLLLMTIMLPLIKQGQSINLSKAILLSIPIGSTIGGLATPVGTPPNAIAMGVFTKFYLSFSFLDWFIVIAPISLVLLIITRLLIQVLFPIEKGAAVRIESDDRTSLTQESWGVILIFFITVILWLTSPIHHIGEGVIALLPIVLLFMTGLLEPKELKEMGWDTLFLVGGGMSLGIALNESGLINLLIKFLYYYHISSIHIVIVIAASTLILSTFMSNSGVTSLMLPLIIGLGVNGNELIPYVLFVALAASLALALPISTPANAIIMSSGYVRSIDLLKLGGIVSIVGFMVLYLATVIYWPLFFK